MEDQIAIVHEVAFDPPLWLQRRGWILNVLRKERVHTVLDVGCGEGSLLRALCEPSPIIRPTQHTPAPVRSMELHLTHVAGLDIDRPSLDLAIENTAPPIEQETISPWTVQRKRWNHLQVDLWEGSLEAPNPAFLDAFDCIVATEVVEHVPSSILDLFLPTLLGYYRPPLLLLTTPNYSFNQMFTPPSVVDPQGYLDPSGNTTRTFRHHDHKREWTVAEFKEWCERGGEDWGYDLEIGGVGLPTSPDPWGRDEEAGIASQTALFRRRPRPHQKTDERSHSVKIQTNDHRLVQTQSFMSDPRSGKPVPRADIISVVQSTMQSWNEGTISVDHLWGQGRLDESCGGDLDALLGAMTGDGWRIVQEGREVWDWKIHWEMFVPSEAHQQHEKDGWPVDSISPASSPPRETSADLSPLENQEGWGSPRAATW